MTIEIRTHRDLRVIEDIADRFGVFINVDVSTMLKGHDEPCKGEPHVNGVPVIKKPHQYKQYGYKKNTHKKASGITKTMATSQAITNLENYFKIPELKVHTNTRVMQNWDKKPFDEDGWIFNDSDPEMIAGDLFDQVPMSKIKIVEPRNKKYPMGKWGMVKTPDKTFNWHINENLKRATPNNLSPDLGQAGIIDQKFADNQSARQIFEDCQYGYGQIRIPQLTAPGACSIPSHLRIEQMAKFIGISLKQARVLAKIYRILGLDFRTVAQAKIGKSRKTLNNHIRTFVKTTGKPPWEIKVSNGLTLLKLAQEIKALVTEDQEDPEWAKSDYKPDNIAAMFTTYETKESLDEYYEEYIDPDMDESSIEDQAERNMWLSMSGEHYRIVYEDQNKDAQFEQSNPVGEYTYWNNSVIPTPNHLEGHNGNKFARLVSKMENFELSNQAIIQEGEWVRKKGTPSQKAEWKRLVHWVTSIRAMGEMVNTMNDYSDIREQATKSA